MASFQNDYLKYQFLDELSPLKIYIEVYREKMVSPNIQ